MSHPVAETVFLFFLVLTLASSGVVVFSANLVRSAFALLLTFFGVAGIYVLLGADFLAATQVLIYVGGILVLLLFAVMLTHRIQDARLSSESRHRGRAGLLAALVFVMLALMALATPWPQHPLPDAPTTAPIGEQLLSAYLLPFEAVSVLLLVVMVGAAVIARREEPS
jgi:NADH-quinone oxidoreductase subunit J